MTRANLVLAAVSCVDPVALRHFDVLSAFKNEVVIEKYPKRGYFRELAKFDLRILS